MDITESALAWAEQNVPVFPCSTDKRPKTPNGFYDASIDVDVIRSAFVKGDFIGARMGHASGLIAIDFDLYKEGADEYLQSLIEQGLLPSTQIHTTKSGGLHFIYRSDTQWPNCKPHKSVEVKGEGGYVIVPPSEGYAIQQQGITTAPDALIELLLATKRESQSTTLEQLKQQVLSAEAFHDPITQISARLFRRGLSSSAVQQELLALLNASVASSEHHERHDRWMKLVTNDQNELTRITNTGSRKYNVAAKSDLVRDLSSDAIDRLFATREQALVKHYKDDGDWPFENVGYFANEQKDLTQQRYIMFPLIAERETILLAAEPKAGKTAIALKLALQVSLGEDLGSLKVTEPRPALYFTLEGARAVEMRIAAEQRHRANDDRLVTDRSMLFVVDRPHDFFNTDQQRVNCEKIIAHSNKCKKKFGHHLGLVVIDTITKAMPGGDQNSVEDTSRLFKMVDALRTAGLKSSILFLHHLSKQGNVRGSTNIEAEVDMVLKLTKNKGGNVVMHVHRARSIDEDLSYTFDLESYDLGTTVQGHKLSAPLVKLLQGSGKQKAMAEHSAFWGSLCKALIQELGPGEFGHRDIAHVLYKQKLIKTKSYQARSVIKKTQELFTDKHQWAYSDHLFKCSMSSNGIIRSFEIRSTD